MDLAKNDSLIDTINSKGTLNKDVTDATIAVFALLKKVLQSLEKSLKSGISDNRIKIKYKDTSSFESEFSVVDDVLVFIMHTNAFVFEPSNNINNTGYVKEDSSRATCGMISIYNFLSDSFQYERKNDVGYLIARLFINREQHFYVEGKKQLGVLFNDFSGSIISEEAIITLVENAIQFSLSIDPIVPPFDMMREISVDTALEYSLLANIANGKRLGFKFEKDSGNTEL
jgi:hypothetical protein